MGVFVPAFNLEPLNLGIISLTSAQQLFLLGGLAITVGIITYSKRVMETIGSNIVELSPEAAMVVVLAQSLVLFIFSSSWLSNLFVRIGLPPIPMVPVSSSQVIVGCVIGIGIYKGARNINFRLLGEIAAGWLATPVVSGVLAYISLFFVKNIFNISVGFKSSGEVTTAENPAGVSDQATSEVFRYLLAGILLTGLILIIYFYLLERKKAADLRSSEKRFWKYLK
jgi:PiT family inorganic phosphate transporter